ncbi:MAG: carbamoyl-phosphate synthase small subunit [Leptolyngbya sp. PLA3]|nr:MAG: carbamoyl-phosphate synthase small subunit [Cyanobacteria bacterium CYA]MCE7968551.1 carbamoyl-phosphate synthase small subunit [Leptolyngbya sp. PL-A3]
MNQAKPSSLAPVARLALADGSVFTARAFGDTTPARIVIAEVVFNTAMTGYQESLTDPSYSGQILVQTAPLIGNTGVNPVDVESGKVHVAGFVVHELAARHSNYRATDSLSHYLAIAGVPGLSGIDTRALVRILRSSGAMMGALAVDSPLSDAQLVQAARDAGSMDGANLVTAVGCTTPIDWDETRDEWAESHAQPAQLRVIALDCGVKRNILRHLTERGCSVRVLPHGTPAAEILGIFERGQADGLFISNGPGDPAAVEATIRTLREVIQARSRLPIPTFGICLGHQLLALAVGARTYKLKFGHRGANQPVLSSLSGHVEITSQNHGFAVDPDSLLATGAQITHIHLNDGTVAGFRLPDAPVFSVQYHPEASPGPHDASTLFDAFVDAMRSRRSPGTEKIAPALASRP